MRSKKGVRISRLADLERLRRLDRLHARRVMIVTAGAIASYLALWIAEPHLVDPVHYHVGFVIMLLAIAGCLVHQVRRVKTLSDYFESRR